MNETKLLNLKKQIDIAKTRVSELQGQQKYLIQELKEKYTCNTIKEAEKLYTKMGKDITTMDEQIEKCIKELREEYYV